MNGLAPHTEKIFERISHLDCVKDYILMGGTALALHLHHRYSEELDFCCGHKTQNERLKVDWHHIQQQLLTIGDTKNILLENTQCDFLVEGVRVTFLADNKFKQPEELKRIYCLNNIYLVDIESIAVMKMEVMTHRNVFRDYYDMYSILQSGVPLSNILSKAGKYTFHNLRTRDMLSLLLNAQKPAFDVNFTALLPIYNQSFDEMKKFFVEKAKEFIKNE
jgi:predicted nucleotidyltransferase component of viral defense system